MAFQESGISGQINQLGRLEAAAGIMISLEPISQNVMAYDILSKLCNDAVKLET